jgi:hypothetical protein
MKHNRSPLYVNPGDIFSTTNDTQNPIQAQTGISTALQMANLTYFNYALSESEIVGLFQKKFTQEAARAPMDNEVFEEDKYSIAVVSEQSNNLPIAF